MTDERPASPPPDEDTTVTPAPLAMPAPPPTPAPMPQPAPQPATAWAPAPAVVVADGGPRTTLSLVAGIILVILGALGALVSLAILTIGREFISQFDFGSLPGLEGFRDPNGIVESAVTFGGVFLLACSVVYVLGGVGVIRSAGWGRVLGIVIGILAGLIWLGSLRNGGAAARGDITFAIVLLALHAYVAVSLLFFWKARGSAT